MSIYIITTIVALFFAYITSRSTDYLYGKKNISIIIASIPLFVLSALREGIGTDYYTYVEMFQRYFSNGIIGNIEPLFYLLNRFVSILNMHYHWIFVFCAMIYTLYVYKAIFEESPNVVFSVYLLITTTYYFSSFNTMREHVGCALLLYSLSFLKRKKYFKFLLLFTIAVGFHYSCIAFLPILFLRNINLDKKKVIVLTVFFILVRVPLFNFLVYIFNGTKYAGYLVQNTEPGITAILGIIIQVAILLFTTYTYDDNETYRTYYWLQLLTTWCTILGASIQIFTRLKWIYGYGVIILIPIALQNIKNKRNKTIFSIAIACAFAIYMFLVIVVAGSYEVIPYESILY